MKKILVAVAAILALFALTGCGDKAATTAAPAPTPVVSETPSATPTTPTLTPEMQFVSSIRSFMDSKGYYSLGSDEALIKLGKDFCQDLDNGKTVSEIFNYWAIVISQGGVNTDEAATLIGGGVVAAAYFLCPVHRESVMAQVESNSYTSA